MPDVTAGPALVSAAHGHGAVMGVLRRQLGSDPECGLSTPRTQARILTAIAGLPADVHTGDRLSSVVAVIRGAHPGGVVLLRADTVTATTNPGHAAIHTAGLVGAAWTLADLRDRLAGDVVCAWQPGSAGHGGAALMLDEGLLDVAGRPVDAAYAIHTVPGLPRGVVAVRPGPILAGVDRLQVTIAGDPGAVSRPVAVACHVAGLVDRLQAGDAALTVDQVTTSGQRTAVLTVTVHARHPAGRAHAHDLVARLAGGYATAHGLHAAIQATATTPTATNDPGEASRVGRVATALYGRERLVDHLAGPVAAPDDVGDILAAVPGAVALLLGALPGDATDITLLPTTAALYAGLAAHRLAARRVTPATVRTHIHPPPAGDRASLPRSPAPSRSAARDAPSPDRRHPGREDTPLGAGHTRGSGPQHPPSRSRHHVSAPPALP